MRRRPRAARGLLAVSLYCLAPLVAPLSAQGEPPFTVLVMDPLAAPLACACVEGYAQRDYEVLGAWLQDRLGEPVRVIHGESLPAALKRKAQGRVDVVIGKHSVIEHDAQRAELAIVPLASLTGEDGTTTQTGLVVVRAADPATKIVDLRDRRIFFGPAECEEKHAAVLSLLERHLVPLPRPLETAGSCSEAALKLLALGDGVPAAAVISSYAKPLLEGCGTIDAGSLRVVAQTAPVPFIAAFATERVDAEREEILRAALLATATAPRVLDALQTDRGFVAYEPRRAAVAWRAWGGFRGPARSGRVQWLPDRLPDAPRVLWQRKMNGEGLAGIAATETRVITVDRDAADTEDIWRCLDSLTGDPVWQFSWPARGELDYGNSPRATPWIDGDRAFLLGARGHLHCVSMTSGELLWHRDLAEEYGAEIPMWGYCASPLIEGGSLLVAPGAELASLVALDPATGDPEWETPGAMAAYASFITGTLGGRRQLVGYDIDSLGGWDPGTGERLWRLAPPAEGDFNVPSPIPVNGRLLVTTENNGTRLYGFADDGTIRPEPEALFRDLAPDTSTPVLVGNRLFGCCEGLFCLDVDDGLKPIWTSEDEVYCQYSSLIASDYRVLITTLRGELVLVDATTDHYRELSRVKITKDRDEIYSFPAIVRDRLYVRGVDSVRCLLLSSR